MLAGPRSAGSRSAALALLALASVLYAAAPSDALAASVALALATVLAVPVAFTARAGRGARVSERAPRLSTLAMALGGVRGTTLRSVALAATGAVALFGSVALGGARSDLLAGSAASRTATPPTRRSGSPSRAGTRPPGSSRTRGSERSGSEGLPGVGAVRAFQGSFLTLGSRRVWVIARPPGGAEQRACRAEHRRRRSPPRADRLLAHGGWVALSQQIAANTTSRSVSRSRCRRRRARTPTALAALTTNLAWSPGVLFMGSADFTRAWGSDPERLAVHPAAGVSTAAR